MKFLVLVFCLLLVSNANAAIRVTYDEGGLLDRYELRWNRIARSGQKVIIDGVCNSACTMFLGRVKNICATSRASLGFHTAFQLDSEGIPAAVDYFGQPIPNAEGTRRLTNHYPKAVRDWIARHGGLTPRIKSMRAPDIWAAVPRC